MKNERSKNNPEKNCRSRIITEKKRRFFPNNPEKIRRKSGELEKMWRKSGLPSIGRDELKAHRYSDFCLGLA